MTHIKNQESNTQNALKTAIQKLIDFKVIETKVKQEITSLKAQYKENPSPSTLSKAKKLSRSYTTYCKNIQASL